MLAYFDQREHHVAQGMGRYHPWTVTTNTPDGRYVDFKAHPELIEATLEDLAPIAASPLAKRIVAFFTWLNGPDSIFESNDFGLRPIKANESGISPAALELHARFTILFRDLARNTRERELIQFAHDLEATLKVVEPDFRDACWGWALWPHLFTALQEAGLPAEGACITLPVWAWGDTEEIAQGHLIHAIDILQFVLAAVARN